MCACIDAVVARIRRQKFRKISKKTLQPKHLRAPSPESSEQDGKRLGDSPAAQRYTKCDRKRPMMKYEKDLRLPMPSSSPFPKTLKFCERCNAQMPHELTQHGIRCMVCEERIRTRELDRD